MSSNFFTNSNGNTLFAKFKGVFENQNISFFEVLVGYFRASGYFKIRPLLTDVEKVRILVGINVDNLAATYFKKGQLYIENPEETKGQFFRELQEELAGADYLLDVEKGIYQFVDDIISGKVEIRATGDKKVHAKIYIMRPSKYGQHNPGSVITGSSNLSDQGLGTHQISNYEFNVLLQRFDDVDYALSEFEDLWKSSTEIKPEEIVQAKRASHLRDDITPYELYLKLLIEYFGKSIDKDLLYTDDLPKKYATLQYQVDAVNQGYRMMMEHNGFILADVVGLGKTVVGAQVARKYVRFNGFNTKILVVHPNALEQNWKSTLKDFDLRNYADFVTTGSLHKILDSENHSYHLPEEYDLIIIDESHTFRSNDSNRYALLQLICKTPRSRAGNDTDLRKKIMLISATPLNNKPDDIANQVYLFQDARASTIPGVPNLQSFFASKIKAYQKLRKIQDHDKLIREVKKIYFPIRDKVMSQVIIRRTRADISGTPEYKADMERQGIKFPDVGNPEPIHYEFDEVLAQLFYDTVSALIDKDSLQYFRYRAIEFLARSEDKELYDNADQISRQLAHIMKTSLTKRLESSFYAFRESLGRLQRSNKRMIKMIEEDKVYIAPDLDINKLYESGKEDRIDEQIEKLQDAGKENNRIFKTKAFKPEFLKGLKHDQKIIDDLVSRWKTIDYDPKLEKFIADLKGKLESSENLEGKIVIFSESTDTVDYLRRNLEEAGYTGVLGISADNQKTRFNTVRANFDANYETKKQQDDFNIIISTEVLAEGVNLHRANFVLNYDIPWNATRLMQRIGRVNRLGTKAEKIHVFNFYPTSHSNRLIELNEKALKKLQGFHTAFSEDSRIYHELEEMHENILGKHQGQKEEMDAMLQKLTFIRSIKENNPALFKRINDLPLKIRLARQLPESQKKAADLTGKLTGYSLSYLRNDFQDGFFLSNGKEVESITFYQAVKLFEAVQDSDTEKRVLPEVHFDHVEKALEEFRLQIETPETYTGVDESNLSAQENSALSFLKGLKALKHVQNELFPDSFERRIDTAVTTIYMGTFRQLRIKIARLAQNFKKKKMPASEGVKQLSKIFVDFPLDKIERMEDLRKEQRKARAEQMRLSKPQVVLSTTYLDK